MVVVTISTLAKLPLLREELVLVVKSVLLLPGELVGSVVERPTQRREMIRMRSHEMYYLFRCLIYMRMK
jgi:hypothetical protein